ncbi:MAG: hypothetical protein ACTS45_01855 [Candidatus Hodgkinia cicadicola]
MKRLIGGAQWNGRRESFSPDGLHGWDCNPMVVGWKDGLCCVRNRGSDYMEAVPKQNGDLRWRFWNGSLQAKV